MSAPGPTAAPLVSGTHLVLIPSYNPGGLLKTTVSGALDHDRQRLAAFALALATPARERRDRLWWATWTMLLVTPVAGLRTMLARHTARLATGMGGAAVLHLPLLLCLGVMVGAAMDEGRSQRVRRASLVGAVLALTLAARMRSAGAAPPGSGRSPVTQDTGNSRIQVALPMDRRRDDQRPRKRRYWDRVANVRQLIRLLRNDL